MQYVPKMHQNLIKSKLLVTEMTSDRWVSQIAGSAATAAAPACQFSSNWCMDFEWIFKKMFAKERVLIQKWVHHFLQISCSHVLHPYFVFRGKTQKKLERIKFCGWSSEFFLETTLRTNSKFWFTNSGTNHISCTWIKFCGLFNSSFFIFPRLLSVALGL